MNQQNVKGGGQSLTLHSDILNAINNWQAYLYVREKYGKFLDELPIYKGTGGDAAYVLVVLVAGN